MMPLSEQHEKTCEIPSHYGTGSCSPVAACNEERNRSGLKRPPANLNCVCTLVAPLLPPTLVLGSTALSSAEHCF